MYICKYCNKEFKSKSNYHSNKRLEKHIIHCHSNPNRINYKCKYCDKEELTPAKIASHVSSCKLNSNYETIRLKRVENSKVGRPHSQETKDKISIARKKYLMDNPDKVPYLLNHSRKESYPEKYFTEVFLKEEINVVKCYRVSLYELDFSIPDRKIDIEIDGSQHYLDKKIVESDKRRTEYLESNGWDIIRIDWAKYQKMSLTQRSNFIFELKQYIDNIISKKPLILNQICINSIKKKSKIEKCKKIKTKKNSKRNKKKCIDCENYTSGIRCNKCRRINDRKVVRPSLDILLEEIKELGYRGCGRKYGVSDNSIRKWLKR